MTAMYRYLVIAFALLLAACAAGGAQIPRSLPYDGWHLGFAAPNGMSVWVEAAEAQDVRGRLFAKLESGTAAINYAGDAAGWGRDVGLGAGRRVTGADLPARIYVRWQSLVEPQTYRAFLTIDERTRVLMRQSDPAPADLDFPKGERFPRKYLVLGLAPGGWIKGWVTSASGDPIEVLCTRAEIEPKGPDLGEYGGRYVTLNERAKAYLAEHPVPYGSWDCGK